MNNKEKLYLVKQSFWPGAPPEGTPLNIAHWLSVPGAKQQLIDTHGPNKADDYVTFFDEVKDQNRDSGLGSMPSLSINQEQLNNFFKRVTDRSGGIDGELTQAEVTANRWNPKAQTISSMLSGGLGGALGGGAGAGLGYFLGDKFLAKAKGNAEKEKRQKHLGIATLAGAIPGGLLGMMGGRKLADSYRLKETLGYKTPLNAWRGHSEENWPVRS